VVHQPQRRLGDAGGPLLDLNAEHLVHVHAREQRDVGHGLPAIAHRIEDFKFEQAQLAVGDDQEVAAAAGGVEERERAQLLVERRQPAAVVPDRFELGPQVVEKQGVDQLEDIAFGGVVRPDLTALRGLHDRLEERAEHGGRDPAPVEAGAADERIAHLRVHVGQRQCLREQPAVHVGQAQQALVEVLLTLLARRVEHLEEPGEVQAEIRAVRPRLVLDVLRESVGVEDAGVLGEEAEEDAHQEAFQRVAGVAAGRHGVVKPPHDLGRPDVNRIFLAERADLVAGNEAEEPHVAVEVAHPDLDALDVQPAEQRQVARLLRLQVVKREAVEVGDDHIARDLVVATLGRQRLQIRERLRLGAVQALAAALVLDQQTPLPEQVDEPVLPAQPADRFLEGGDTAARDAEHVEECVPERFGLRLLAGLSGPFPRETHGPLLDLIPPQLHRAIPSSASDSGLTTRPPAGGYSCGRAILKVQA